MGLLNLFSKSQPKLVPLPSGSFTVDRDGRILISTVSRGFPENLVDDVATMVLSVFRSAQQARLPLSEVTLRYSTLKVTARELRGGAIVYLAPQTMSGRRN